MPFPVISNRKILEDVEMNIPTVYLQSSPWRCSEANSVEKYDL